MLIKFYIILVNTLRASIMCADIIKPIITRIDSSQNWRTLNPVPKNGEQCVEEIGGGLFKLKIGDGVTPWIALKYHTEVLIGNLDDLITRRKDTIVSAINSLKEDFDEVIRPIEISLEDWLNLPKTKYNNYLTYLIQDWDGAYGIYFQLMNCGVISEIGELMTIDCGLSHTKYTKIINDALR